MNQSTNSVYLSWVVHNINNSNGRSSVPLCGTAYLTARQLLRMYNIERYDEVQIISLEERVV
jgi:hypothetical protein